VASDRERWDERHRAALADAGHERPAAAWLRAHDDLLVAQPRGPALDIACGTGRNALHLARLGFDVDAIDASGVAVEHLRATAGDLPVRAQRLDLPADPLPGDGYQVIVNTYFLERALFGPISAALAPGGLLLF
jgi:SAM-dependent methyltransferase